MALPMSRPSSGSCGKCFSLAKMSADGSGIILEHHSGVLDKILHIARKRRIVPVHQGNRIFRYLIYNRKYIKRGSRSLFFMVILPADHRRQKSCPISLSGQLIYKLLLVAFKNIPGQAAGGKKGVDSFSQAVSLADRNKRKTQDAPEIGSIPEVLQDPLPFLRIIFL